ncbi:4-deoxy-L-threo-5-hexosulose-uronate ketol-isomerase [Thermocatellispora tengchongensis]|uniref:5-dehydro-4-deoxy-D-glucuronate isomerase n=1 Tax=Thermocatellispora tengchongensis TaxID=1073253 RepID=A0A840PK60_9ACTN|nr:5-dehydro-4-deoxy-D-glucuronate isomerase [Thermocatellispora tengchongensis]MBB5137457.1 4-deoxy-L-threo-5-hexosulose-uronate ketol-isomerase [Thermocatellispora tengchongensis]
MEIRHATDPESVETATAAELRDRYLVTDLFAPGEVCGLYTHEDRMVIAGAMPADQPLAIPAWEAVGTPAHLDRRELGVVNLGDPGDVIVDGSAHKLGTLDGLYVGKGSDIRLSGEGACYLLVSAPADATHPTARFSRDTVEPLALGEDSRASRRDLYRYVWGGGHPSCRLQFGVTVVHDGSVWNTMPPHLHDRRTEIYLYTGLAPGDRVIHLLGRPGATRHLLVADRQAVISPAWSVHAGAGTGPYAFVWAMAGENTDYGDLQTVTLEQL